MSPNEEAQRMMEALFDAHHAEWKRIARGCVYCYGGLCNECQPPPEVTLVQFCPCGHTDYLPKIQVIHQLADVKKMDAPTLPTEKIEGGQVVYKCPTCAEWARGDIVRDLQLYGYET